MIKIYIYICPNCGKEREEFLEPNWQVTLMCEKCGELMQPFNFKNNSQRWYFQDQQKG